MFLDGPLDLNHLRNCLSALVSGTAREAFQNTERGGSGAGIAELLDDRFELLTAGPRMAPARQQSLLATISWSYALLNDEERPSSAT